MLKATRKKRLNRRLGGDIAIFVFLGLVGAFMLLPFIYALVQSVKPLDEIFIFPPRFFVTSPTLENFSSLFKLAGTSWVPFTRYLFSPPWRRFPWRSSASPAAARFFR